MMKVWIKTTGRNTEYVWRNLLACHCWNCIGNHAGLIEMDVLPEQRNHADRVLMSMISFVDDIEVEA